MTPISAIVLKRRKRWCTSLWISKLALIHEPQLTLGHISLQSPKVTKNEANKKPVATSSNSTILATMKYRSGRWSVRRAHSKNIRKLDIGDNTYPEIFNVMKNLRRPKISLHFMKHNSRTDDEWSNSLLNTCQCKSRQLLTEQKNKVFSSLTIDWQYHLRQLKQSQTSLIIHRDGIRLGLWDRWRLSRKLWT